MTLCFFIDSSWTLINLCLTSELKPCGLPDISMVTVAILSLCKESFSAKTLTFDVG